MARAPSSGLASSVVWAVLLLLVLLAAWFVVRLLFGTFVFVFKLAFALVIGAVVAVCLLKLYRGLVASPTR